MADAGSFWETPILTVNYNHLSFLQKQLNWLLRAGYRKIFVVDNCSSYPPLLQYYAHLEEAHSDAIHVVKLEKNFGHYALWDAELLEQLGIDGRFVYTDGDIVPDPACPGDVVAHLGTLLNKYPIMVKVGLGLRIDNLPEAYRFRDQAIAWESQFWRMPVARGLFHAAIDTTFAIYRGRGEFKLAPALRTGWPYLARHEPWYCALDNPSEEQRFYDESPKVHAIHWSGEGQPEWLRTAIDRLQVANKTFLHLGCGQDILGAWINLDAQDHAGVDLVFDLNSCASTPLPLDDNAIDGFFMARGFDAVDNVFDMMQELYRVAKPGAKFLIRIPRSVSRNFGAASARHRRYLPDSLNCFAQPACSEMDRRYRGDWDPIRVKLVVGPDLLQDESILRERIKREPSLVDEMIVELQAIKPGRPRDPRLLESVRPALSGDHLDLTTKF